MPNVLSIRARSTIHAPIDTVWGALLDFGSYPQWNSYIRCLVPGPCSPQTQLSAGQTATMRVNLPPRLSGLGARELRVGVDLVDHAQHRARWHVLGFPAWALHSDRWIILTEVLDPDGLKATIFETEEAFGGVVAWVLRVLRRGSMQSGFEAMAVDLKTRAEWLQAAR